jgi:uncharacterized protein
MKNYIHRKDYIDKLLAYKDHDLIKVITGIRRSGKSTLFQIYRKVLLDTGILESQIVFLNFEDYENKRFLSDLDALYSYIVEKIDISKPSYVFLDEIQNVYEFERLVDGLYVKENIDVYITGSNAFLLSGELATLLSGRYIEISILPFSFKEYLVARNIDLTSKYLNYEAFFFDYVNETSLPKGIELRQTGLDKVAEYLRAVYTTVVEKDITQRHKIYDKRAFENVVKFLATTIGSLVSASNISKILKQNGQITHNTTVDRYLDYLVASFVFYKVHRFDLKGKKQLSTLEKYYIVDLGFLNILSGKERGSERGHFLENIVYLELVRRGYLVWAGTSRNSEVDFVCKTQLGDIEYYQVAWQLTNDSVIEREYTALEKINDNYPKFLLSTDNFMINRGGIKHLNVFSWLLDFSIY